MKVEKILSALPEPSGRLNQPKESKIPWAVKLLRRVIEWQRLIEFGDVRSQAEIARREGITRVRVTMLMGAGSSPARLPDTGRLTMFADICILATESDANIRRPVCLVPDE